MAQYYSLLTAIGAAQIANAISLGGTVTVTQFAVGTGNGAEYDPTEDQTALKSEVYRGNINSIDIVTGTPNVIEFHCVIPVTEGGWTLREVGLFDADGNLLVIAKYPSSYKPVQSEGTAGDFSLKIQVGVVNTDVVELKIDPAVVLATKKNVEVALNNHQNDDTAHPHDHDDRYAGVAHTHHVSEITGLQSIPVGTSIYFNGLTPPVGFLKENGVTLDRELYPKLWAFAQISGKLADDETTKDADQFGPGDGLTTFSIPDSRGQFVRGFDDGKGIDVGRPFGTSQLDQIQAHTHALNAAGGSNYGISETAGYSSQADPSALTTSTGGNETRPRNVSRLICIKY